MKGFKLNIESVNCVLLVVILALVVVCCVKKPTEGFWGWKKINYRKLCKKYKPAYDKMWPGVVDWNPKEQKCIFTSNNGNVSVVPIKGAGGIKGLKEWCEKTNTNYDRCWN
jgi:hypothetical protein